MSKLFLGYSYKNLYKSWNLHFHKTYDHQIWQAGTPREIDSNETNQAGADDIITSRSYDQLKTYIHYEKNW